MNTKEFPQVPPSELYPKKKRTRAAWITGGSLAALLVGGLGYVVIARPTADAMGIQPPITSSHPSESLQATSPGLGSQVENSCGQQFSGLEGAFDPNTGKHILTATSAHPSMFVISPDRSRQEAFTEKAADTAQNEWYTVTKDASVGIVGIATSDTIFDTNGGKAVWTKTCLANPDATQKEVDSRVADLCATPEYPFHEVVVYDIDKDGDPRLKDTVQC